MTLIEAGVGIRKKGKELTDMREFVFEIWLAARKEGKLLRISEIQQLLRRKFPVRPVQNGTIYCWISRWKEGRGLAKDQVFPDIKERETHEEESSENKGASIWKKGKELNDVRGFAFENWAAAKTEGKESPLAGMLHLLRQKFPGRHIPKSTVYCWMKRWKEGKGLAKDHFVPDIKEGETPRKELDVIKGFACKIWVAAKAEGKELSLDKMLQLLRQMFPDRPVGRSTVIYWMKNLKEGKWLDKAQFAPDIKEGETPQEEEINLEESPILEQDKELDSIKRFAYEIWVAAKKEGKELPLAEMQKLLHQKFPDRPVGKSTLHYWVRGWKRGKRLDQTQFAPDIKERETHEEEGSEPKGAAIYAVGRGRRLTGALAVKRASLIAEFERTKGFVHVPSLALQFGVHQGTIYRWLTVWKDNRTPGRISQVFEAVPELTWERIVELVPNVPSLGEIVLEGIIGRISRLSKENANLTEELDETKADLEKVTELYNSIRANRRIGTLTLDSVQHRLIPKV